MTLKKLYISTGILAVLAVITSLLNRPDSEPKRDPRVGESIVSAEILREANQIEFSSGNKSVTFVNQPDNKKWVVEERINMPADFSRLSRQIGHFLDGKLQKLVSTNPERISTFGFESGDKVRFLDSSNGVIAELELGKEADGGRQFLRFSGEDKAFLITNSISLSVDPDSWLKKKLVEIPTNEVASIDIKLSGGEAFSADRDPEDDKSWLSESVPDGKELDGSAIDRLVARLTGLNFTSTTSSDAEEVAEAKNNSHSFVLSTKSGNAYTFALGRRPEIKVEKEVESMDEEGNAITEIEEVVEQEKGPTYLFIESSNPDDPINGYMASLAFEVAEYQFTNLPSTTDDLLQDAPEPKPEGAVEEVEEAAEEFGESEAEFE